MGEEKIAPKEEKPAQDTPAATQGASNTQNAAATQPNAQAAAGTQYGGFWIRLLAAILDGIIIGIPTAIIGWLLVFGTGISSMTYVAELAAVVFIVYMDGIKGGTPGKLLLHMRIVNENAEFIGIPSAILRYVGKILSGIILGIGYLMIAWDGKKQGLHDKIAKTYVVKV